MPIQLGAPVDINLEFRDVAESGRDLGPLNLTLPEMDPLQLILRRPDGTLIVVPDADIQLVDGPNGLARWSAEEGEIDAAGVWSAQGWAGPWPSLVARFVVKANIS